MLEKFYEKTISREVIYDGKVVHLVVDEVTLPDGNLSKRELVLHQGAVGIYAITADQRLICVRQFRKALEKTIIEIPAGKIEKDEKDYELTARRELEEETGYQCDKMEKLTQFISSPGFSNEILYLYQATGLTKVEDPLPQDEDEFLEIIELTLAEALEKINTGEICDAKTMYAILYWQQQMMIKER
ncbi:NUDIX hydrolase [Vagococcus sp.]|uniref:NUDIX hydrolase n=1 Tax=Vagococcus sp. TaxID=1933889 RepID=UPI003F99414C